MNKNLINIEKNLYKECGVCYIQCSTIEIVGCCNNHICSNCIKDCIKNDKLKCPFCRGYENIISFSKKFDDILAGLNNIDTIILNVDFSDSGMPQFYFIHEHTNRSRLNVLLDIINHIDDNFIFFIDELNNDDPSLMEELSDLLCNINSIYDCLNYEADMYFSNVGDHDSHSFNYIRDNFDRKNFDIIQLNSFNNTLKIPVSLKGLCSLHNIDYNMIKNKFSWL